MTVVHEEIYREALQEIEKISFGKYMDWMHFHEIAMDSPFDAEAEATEFASHIRMIATDALGAESSIEVISGEAE